MAKEFAMSFYNSTAWKNCREAYRKKMCYICERCGAAGVIVHHKIRITPATIKDPEVLLSFDNLELLCRSCHQAEHAQDEKPKKIMRHGERFTVDECGHVIAV